MNALLSATHSQHRVLSFEEEDNINDGLVNVEELEVEIDGKNRHIASYCITLLATKFYGQTSCENSTDKTIEADRYFLHLGTYIKCLDRFVRKFDQVTDFTGTEEEYLYILRLCALKRKNEIETSEECYERLLEDSHRFVKLYHERGVKSELLKNKKYWGTRQQLLAGKVIADWVDRGNGRLDPIFGVLMNPTAGRVGPGDSGSVHKMLFDNSGPMAYHSAVHDAFGYLNVFHGLPPGYAYIRVMLIAASDPMAGQVTGIAFWKALFRQLEATKKIVNIVYV